MARLALTVGLGVVGGLLAIATAGAATPAIFGLGFSLGSVVGGIAGSLLFPPGGAMGARLADLQVCSSAPGNPIPFGYGTFKFGGQIIWAQTIQEHKKSSSAKGGPSQVTYDYTCSFAVSFGEGPGTIAQLWADSQCIYDTTGTQQVGKLQDSNGNHVQLNMVIYPGDEAQMPDPTIVSFMGANVTPAYRGQVYCVFDNLDLTNFGNRIPNMRAVVNYGNSQSFLNSSVEDNVEYPVIDSLNRVYYVFSPDRVHCSKFSLVDNSVIFKDMLVPWPAGYELSLQSDLSGHAMAECDINGFLWVVMTNGVSSPLSQLNPNTLQVLNQFSIPGGLQPFTMNSYAPNDGFTYFAMYANGYMAIYRNDGTFVSANAFELSGGELFSNVDSISSNAYPCPDDQGNVYMCGSSTLYSKWYIWNNGGQEMFQHAGVSGVGDGMVFAIISNPQNNTLLAFSDTGRVYVIDTNEWNIIATYGNVSTSNTWPGQFQVVALSYLILDDFGSIQECTTAGETGQYEPNHYPVDVAGQIWNQEIGGTTQDGGVTWTCLGTYPFFDVTDTNFGPKAVMIGLGGRIRNGVFLAVAPSSSFFAGKILVCRGADLVAVSNFDFFSDFVGTPNQNIGDWRWEDVYASIIAAGLSNISSVAVIDRAYVSRNGAAGSTLSDIITDIATRAGLSTDQLDLTAVTGTVCLGYLVSNPQSAQQCISPLCQAYLFDVVETDFVLKAVPRGASSSWTVPETDLGLVEDKRKVVETLSASVDVPLDVTVTYVDPALDYQQNSQHRKRNHKTTTKKSTTQSIINLPFVMTKDDAIQLADKFTWLSELERQSFDWNAWKALYMLVDPTDVITLNYEGLQFIARTIKNSIGQNYAVEISGVNQDANAYLSTMSGAPQSGFNPGSPAQFGPTLLYLMDTTLMQDKDASPVGLSGMYYAFASPVPSNPGAVLYESSDQLTWNDVSFASDHIAYGFTTSVLAAPTSPWRWDYVNTVTLFFGQPGITLSSTSALNVYNGANGVLIGKELVQYQNAVQNTDGSWTLSNLLRGRRGTEWACGSHVIGETCFFPQVNGGLHRVVMNPNLIGLVQYWKAITVGSDLNSGSSLTATLAGNDVKPYTPVDVQGTKDGTGNLVIQWQRRTRIGAGNSIAGTWPVSEATESYDVVITDSLGVVKRTFSNVTPPGGGWSGPAFPHVTYTAAEQVADFGSVQSTYYLQVFQNSALTFEDGTHRGFETLCVLPLALSSTQRAVETFLYH